MPGGGKGGSSPSGNTTTTTINPTQQAQLPFLTGSAVGPAGLNGSAGWNQALNLAVNNPLQYYPNQTLADFSPFMSEAYNSLINAGIGARDSLYPAANGADINAINGGLGIGNSPALGHIQGLTDEATAPQGDLRDQSYLLGGLANTAAMSPWAAQLGGFANQGSGIGGNLDALHAYGYQAAANPFAKQMADLAGGWINYLVPSQGLIGEAGTSAGQPNAATRSLEGEARGDFLNKNPYIDAQYRAASDPVTRQYMTATAPQTESNYELAGRYGSGVLGNARSQNEQNLGKTLGDLSANMYGQDYANERQLMQGAQSTLGSLINQGLGLKMQAGSALSNSVLNEFAQRGNMLNQAGGQYLSGLQAALGANASAGGLAQNEYAQRGGLYQNAANDWLNAINASGSLRGAASGVDASRLGAIQSGLGMLQSGYDTGNRNAIAGLGLAPSLLSAAATGPQSILSGAQGLTGMNQAQIQDAMNRFYGQEQAPWQTATQYMNLVGQPTSGSNQVRQPYFTNPLANLLGGATGGLGLLNGVNSAFGSGGIFGSGAGALGETGDLSGLVEGALPGEIFGGGGAGGIGSALGAAAAWIICTELAKQGRLPKRYWAAGAKVFAAYPEIAKRGYYVWAIPSVRHLRKRPESLYSRLLCRAFNWRAENIAASVGVRGARKLWRGRAVTAALAIPCLILGAVSRERDWQAVYRDEAQA